MKLEEVEGIIVRETNYSESSKILNILTKEKGLIGVMSKGSRNMKNKLRGVSRKLLYGKFHIYYKENSMSTLIEVDVKNSYSKILSNFDATCYAGYLLNLVEQVAQQNVDETLFDLLRDALDKMNDGLNPLIITNIVELKCLDFLGVTPSIDSCSICGDNKNILTISSIDGGYICKNCHSNQKIVSQNTVKLIRMLYYVDISKISKLEIKEESMNEINEFINDYYDRYTGLYLKNKENLLRVIKKVS